MKLNQKKWGVILTYVSEGILILTTLFYTPVMLKILGQSEYGLYQTVVSFVAYLSILNLGFGSSYVRFYTRSKETENEKDTDRLCGMFFIIFSAIAVICLICGGILLLNIEVVFGNGLSDAEYKKAKVLFSLLIINLAFTFLNDAFYCPVSAKENFVFLRSLNCLTNLLNPFIALPLLLLGYGSVGMVVTTTFLTISNFTITMIYAIKKCKIKLRFDHLKWNLFKEMWGFTFFIFLNQVIDQINWNLDKFLLARYINTATVAVYSVGNQFITMYNQLTGSICNVFVSKVHRLVAKKSSNRTITELFTRIGRIQFYISALIVSGLFFFGKAFINIWAGSDYKESYYVAIIILVPLMLTKIQELGIEIQRAKNKHRSRTLIYFIVAVSNVAISIPLLKVYGAVGAAMGTGITTIIGNLIVVNIYYKYAVKLDIKYFWTEIIKILPSLIIPFVIGSAIMQYANLANVFYMIIFIIIYTAIFAASVWFIAFNDYEKDLIKSLLKIPTVRRR